jgi:hypothetical protein
MSEAPIPEYSRFQPERVSGYKYRGFHIYGGTNLILQANLTSGRRARSDKLTLAQMVRLIDAHVELGATPNEYGAMTNIDFIDHRLIRRQK